MSDLRVAIAGAGGKMGAANIRAVDRDTGHHGRFRPSIAPEPRRSAGMRANWQASRRSALRSPTTSRRPSRGADAIIDFTAPAASVALARKAAKRGLVHIIGTTGCSRGRRRGDPRGGDGRRADRQGRQFLARRQPAAGLVKQAAAALPGFDIEILEMHHNKKVDAPSGHRADAGRGCRERAAISSSTTHSVRVRDGHTGRARAGQHRLCHAARRQRHRRAHA